ncbi:UDP-galactopyranose mutase [Pelomyxa schiedti]|nr:UDP-galactopyranose mutase [Pelomyxa schiedti]
MHHRAGVGATAGNRGDSGASSSGASSSSWCTVGNALVVLVIAAQAAGLAWLVLFRKCPAVPTLPVIQTTCPDADVVFETTTDLDACFATLKTCREQVVNMDLLANLNRDCDRDAEAGDDPEAPDADANAEEEEIDICAASRETLVNYDAVPYGKYDYLVVGAGLTGAVAARLLADSGRRVLVIEKAPRVGGLCYDECDASGVLVHKFGPHVLHTGDRRVIRLLSLFDKWRGATHKELVSVAGVQVPFPPNRNSLNVLFNADFHSDSEADAWLVDQRRQAMDFQKGFSCTAETCQNAEQLLLSTVGLELYDLVYKNYTTKKWGLPPQQLDPSVVKGMPMPKSSTDEAFYSSDEWFQGLPAHGYTHLFEVMLYHPNINVLLNTAYSKIATALNAYTWKHVIVTSPIDEFFAFNYGHLAYRSLTFENHRLDMQFFQKAAVVNYPNDYKFSDIVEMKHTTRQHANTTTIVKETPSIKGPLLYPILTKANLDILAQYKVEAEPLMQVEEHKIVFAGRLGDFAYYSMGEAVLQGIKVFEGLTGEILPD